MLTKVQRVKMVDILCSRIKDNTTAANQVLRTTEIKYGVIGFSTSKLVDGIKCTRTAVVENYTNWTSDQFKRAESIVSKELLG